jgi:uncharacterized protein (DUF342 family)
MDDKTAHPPDNVEPVDASVEIIVTDDEQAAYVGIVPPVGGGRDLTYGDLKKELEKRRIVYGVKDDVLTALADKPVYHSKVVVAQGELPVQGSDAKLTFHFETNREIKPRERSDGTVDYRDLGLIEHVKAGQPLVTLTPVDKGTPGKTVLGRVLMPAPVKNALLPAGKNTMLSEDKLTLLASINGCVEYQSGRTNVYNMFTVRGDVGNATGNVDFDGSIVVNGDVMAGFTVKATGNINVVGNVDGALLEAGGDIKIMAGLVGKGRGRAVCGGGFKALFVENAEISAGGDVSSDVFMNSHVRCGGSLIAEGRHGSVIGGHYAVARDVRAVSVGAPSGVATTFEMGVDPNVTEKVKAMNERLRALEIERNKLNQIIQLLHPLKAAGKLPQEKAEVYERAVAMKESSDREYEELEGQRESMSGETASVSASQFTCKNELYSGTKVSICQVVYAVPSDLVHCRIYLNPQREVVMTSI